MTAVWKCPRPMASRSRPVPCRPAAIDFISKPPPPGGPDELLAVQGGVPANADRLESAKARHRGPRYLVRISLF